MSSSEINPLAQQPQTVRMEFPEGPPIEQKGPIPQEIKPDTVSRSSGTAGGIASMVKPAVQEFKDNAGVPTLMPPGTASKSSLSSSSLVEREYSKVITLLLPDLGSPDEAAELQNQMKNYVDHQTPLANQDLQNIAKQAGLEIQQKFGLEKIYTPGMEINLETINPIAVANVRQEVINENIVAFYETIDSAAQKVSLPPNDPKAVSMQDFLMIIGKALQEVKHTLMESQLQESESLEKNIATEKQLQKESSEMADKNVTETRKQMAKQASMEKFGFAMKIIGPTVAALSTIVAAAVTIATLGAGAALASPLFLAGIAVGVAMTAYSVVDATTGATSKVMEGLNSFVEKLTEDAPEWAQPLVKASLVVGAVAAAAVVVAAISTGSGAGAAANAATQTVSQSLQQAAVMATKQLAIQASIILIMSSNVLIENVESLGKLLGLSDKDANILKYTAMALEMVALMAAAYKMSGGGGKAAGVVTEGVQTTTQQAQSAMEKAQTFVTQAAKATVQQVEEMVDAIVKAIKEFAKSMTDFITNIPNLPADIAASAKNSINSIKELFAREDLWSHLLKKVAPKILERSAVAAPQIVQMASSATYGVFALQTAKILKTTGHIEEEQAILQALIDMLKKLISSLLSGQNDITEALKGVGELYDGMLRQQREFASNVVSGSIQG